MEQLLDRIAKAPLAAKIGGVAGGVVLLTLLNFFLFIQPMEEQIEQQIVQIDALNRDLAEKRSIAQNLTEKRREMAELEQQLQEALTELPMRKDVEELLAQLNDIGKKSGLEISSVEPGTEQSATFFSRIPIRMSVSGSYHEIAMFLQEVANMRRIVNVNNIKLGSPTERNEKVTLKSEFLATTFRFLDQQQNQGNAPRPQ